MIRINLVAAGVVAATLAAALGSHDGEFASTQKWFSTTLAVVEGEDGALVAYSGDFGPGCASPKSRSWCRTCEFGPVLMRREGPATFRYQDKDVGEATVRLSFDEGAWQLSVDGGRFDWCGAGWAGDSFRAKGKPAKTCVIVPAGGRLYPLSEPHEAAGTGLAPGLDVVAITDVPSDDRALVRAGGVVGLVKRQDLRCRN